MQGKIVAVCLNLEKGIPKYPQTAVIIEPFGIRGDAHAGPTRRSHSTGEPKFNDRQISLASMEAYHHLNRELGITLKPGDFGENFTLEGLGDLSDVPRGAIIRIGEYVTLQVTEQNQPCNQLTVYHEFMVKHAFGRRGILCNVENGVGQIVQPGDPIIIEQ